MAYTPAETAERHRYIEKSIESTLADLQDPRIQRSLGSKAVLFEQMLTTAVVANLHHGLISLPADYDYDACPLPIVAFERSEDLALSADFNTQNRQQAQQTIDLFRAWKLREGTPEKFYEAYKQMSETDTITPIDISDPSTAGMIGTTATVLYPDDQRAWFEQAPSKGFTLFSCRPIMLLEKKPGRTGDSPSTISHELSHANQVIQNPAKTIHSQRSIDMQTLREELEAYHDGFGFSALEASAVGIENVKDGSTKVQLHVETIRQRHLVDPADPFKPSGFLWNKLCEKGLDNILHGALNFEVLVELLDPEAITSNA